MMEPLTRPQLAIVTPAVVECDDHRAMVEVQSLLAERLRRELPEWNITHNIAFDHAPFGDIAAHSRGFDMAILPARLEFEQPGRGRGIVRPTLSLIDSLDRLNDDAIILRTIQDAFIYDAPALAREVQAMRGVGPVLGGRWTTWKYGPMPEVADALGLPRSDADYYLGGDLLIATAGVWRRFYKGWPRQIVHYEEDYHFTWRARVSGVGLREINKSWKHEHGQRAPASDAFAAAIRAGSF